MIVYTEVFFVMPISCFSQLAVREPEKQDVYLSFKSLKLPYLGPQPRHILLQSSPTGSKHLNLGLNFMCVYCGFAT